MGIKFSPRLTKVAEVEPIRDAATIKREPMLFSCDLEHAKLLGGPLTREVLEKLEEVLPAPRGGRNWVVDTRVHMLKPHFYPAIPGWHGDAVGRGENGQPESFAEDAGQRHYCVLLETTPDLAPTDFLIEEVEVEIDPEAVWKSVDAAVNEKEVKHAPLPAGNLCEFTTETLHRCTAATGKGWRFFFRCSEMKTAPRNEIRTQVQTYVDINQGW